MVSIRAIRSISPKRSLYLSPQNISRNINDPLKRELCPGWDGSTMGTSTRASSTPKASTHQSTTKVWSRASTVSAPTIHSTNPRRRTLSESTEYFKEHQRPTCVWRELQTGHQVRQKLQLGHQVRRKLQLVEVRRKSNLEKVWCQLEQFAQLVKGEELYLSPQNISRNIDDPLKHDESFNLNIKFDENFNWDTKYDENFFFYQRV